MTMVFSSAAVRLSVTSIRAWPMPSRAPQRFREATQSSAVTAVPSCHFRPSRSTKVQVSWSSLTGQVSTICGCGVKDSSIANRVS